MNKVRYTIAIPNEKYRLIKILHVFLLIIFSLLLIYVSLVKHNSAGIFYAALALLSLLGLVKKIKATTDKLSTHIWDIGFFWIMFGWFQLEIYWLAGLVLIISLLGIPINSAHDIYFSDAEILIKSLPKKTASWTELNNVILKDGLLTIDFKNDKIIQAEILQSESDVTNETEFNNYCKQQLIRTV